jgi:hypothetical protein
MVSLKDARAPKTDLASKMEDSDRCTKLIGKLLTITQAEANDLRARLSEYLTHLVHLTGLDVGEWN